VTVAVRDGFGLSSEKTVLGFDVEFSSTLSPRGIAMDFSVIISHAVLDMKLSHLLGHTGPDVEFQVY
jgi:hypothetical protein